jgi:NitT/TauT family transport system permease protein
MALWEASSRFGWVDELILPSPINIAYSFYKVVIVQGLAWWHFAVTLYEALIGFLIGCVIGIGLAVSCALSERFRKYVTPYIIGLQVTPRIALAPLIIAWMGFGLESKIVFAATICFFPPYINTLTGLLQVDEAALEMFRSLQARKSQIFIQLMLPNAMPVIMAGLKTAMTMSLVAAIVGEFVSASEGMGVLMQRFTFSLNMSASFAVLVLLTIMGLILFLAMELMDNRLVFWHHDKRMAAISRKQARHYKQMMGLTEDSGEK